MKFYSGRGADSEGRFLREIRGWGFGKLESVHDYIQWLFPLRVRSQFNPDAPLLDEETIRHFLDDERLRAELRASFEQMLAFYGFVLREQEGSPVVETGLDWEERRRQWLHFGNHNLLRITRILTCLGTLGLADHARAFLAALEEGLRRRAGGRRGTHAQLLENRHSVIGATRNPFPVSLPKWDGATVVHWLTSPDVLFVGVALLVLLGLKALTARRNGSAYVAANALLSPAERSFFVVLRQAVGSDFLLFTKVRLGDILQVEPGVSGKRRFAAFGRISSKHADFVLCDPRSFAVVGVVELDDRSHQRRDPGRNATVFSTRRWPWRRCRCCG